MSNLLTSFGAQNKLLFDGHKKNDELWEGKFLGYMRIPKLHSVISSNHDHINDSNFVERNASVVAQLI